MLNRLTVTVLLYIKNAAKPYNIVVRLRLRLGLIIKIAWANRAEVLQIALCKCEDEGVYKDVNDRSLRHEERTQDAPLSSVWWR